jgi:hypothetical protein
VKVYQTSQNPFDLLTIYLIERVASLVQILRRFHVVNARVLRLQGGESILHRITKQISEILELLRLPAVVLEEEFLEAGSPLVLLDVRLELGDCVAWEVQLEHQLAHFVVDEASDGFDLHAVGVDDADVFEVCVGLRVVSGGGNRNVQTNSTNLHDFSLQSCREVQSELADESLLELVANLQRLMR